MNKSLSSILIAILPLALAPACAPGESTIGQQITCETDPGTGVVLSCEPGAGDGGENTCTDIDEDGDGDPHDDDDDDDDDGDDGDDDDDDANSFTSRPTGGHGDEDDDEDGTCNDDDDDDDDDGIDDDDDCDDHPGEDSDDDDAADLPYDVTPRLGATTKPVADAFAEKGMQPASIISVTGATWRATELAAGTAFVVTSADCSHAGNRDVGRDRVIVQWANADGSTHADHLDIRYCK